MSLGSVISLLNLSDHQTKLGMVSQVLVACYTVILVKFTIAVLLEFSGFSVCMVEPVSCVIAWRVAVWRVLLIVF